MNRPANGSVCTADSGGGSAGVPPVGDVPSMFSLAQRTIAQMHSGRDLQQALADHLDVKQQSISSWENALFAPRLTSSQWAKLIKLAIAAPERVAS